MCLAGAVVAYWSWTENVAGSSPLTVMTNIAVTNLSNFPKNCMKLRGFGPPGGRASPAPP